jgi:hypothetical protein
MYAILQTYTICPGVNLIKTFWSKLTDSVCKSDNFTTIKNFLNALKGVKKRDLIYYKKVL